MPWIESPAELERARSEVPVVVPTAAGALYGIFTPPDPRAEAANLCVIFFTRPRSHRNRMWVEGARRLATQGFAAFRFDYHGVGESEGESHFLDPNRPFRDDAVAVVRHLQGSLGQRRFVVVGMCFGARTALSTFQGAADVIDGMVFMAAPVMEIDAMEKVYAGRRTWGDVVRAMADPKRWRELLDFRRAMQIGSVVSRMVLRRHRTSEHPPPQALAPSFLEAFEAFRSSGARALIVYGREDREYDSFRPVEERLLPSLPRAVRERIQLEVWPGEVHAGPTEMTRQQEIKERALEWVLRLHPGRAGGSGTAAAATAGAAPAPGASGRSR